jgi:hypothetical protein
MTGMAKVRTNREYWWRRREATLSQLGAIHGPIHGENSDRVIADITRVRLRHADRAS